MKPLVGLSFLLIGFLFLSEQGESMVPRWPVQQEIDFGQGVIKIFLSSKSAQAAKVNKAEVCNVKKMDRSAEIVFVLGRRDVYLPKNNKEMGPHCQ